MNPDSELPRLLARIAAEDATLEPPQDLERRVLAQFNARPHRKSTPTLRYLIAAACVVVLVLALSVRPKPKQLSETVPFSPLPYAAPAAPYEQLEVQRQQLPVSALIAAGFDFHLANPAGLVSADVLVGQDGRPLAVRLSPAEENRR